MPVQTTFRVAHQTVDQEVGGGHQAEQHVGGVAQQVVPQREPLASVAGSDTGPAHHNAHKLFLFYPILLKNIQILCGFYYKSSFG